MLPSNWLRFGGCLLLVAALTHCGGEEDSPFETIYSAATSCGVERWSVKTGTDPDVSKVNLTPQDTTIGTLGGYATPSSLPSNNRIPPQEEQVYRLTNVTLTFYKLEDDSDFHLVVSDGTHTMIAEVPSPDCVGSTSPFASEIAAARQEVLNHITPTTTAQTTSMTISVEGVGFFDALHGQTGVAPNGIELHPVLGICFGQGCTLPSTGGGGGGGGGGTGITNGNFETGSLSGWTSSGSASVSTTAHGGSYSAMVGSTGPTTDSSIKQSFTVPSGGGTLSFYYRVVCPDTVSYDWASATLKDTSGNTLATIVGNTCTNSGSWVQATQDLSSWANQTVVLVLANHDDNYSGDATYTYYDDVTLSGGTSDTTPPTVSISSPASGATVSGTTTISASASDNVGVSKVEFYVDGTLLSTDTTSAYSASWNTTSASNGSHTLTAKAYDAAGNVGTSSSVSVTVSNSTTTTELVTNGGFEGSLSSWTLGGAKNPIDSTAHPHSGSYSLRCGATTTTSEPNGDSYAYQTISIPATVTKATLTFWYYAYSTDTVTYDWQEAKIRSSSGSDLLTIFHMADNSQVWTQKTVDLTSYRGQSIELYFNAHGDGATDPTTLWVDDVSLLIQ